MSEQLNEVDRALLAWRGDDGKVVETLSEGARGALFARVSTAQGGVAMDSRLFFPLRRWALAGGIPLALTFALAWLGNGEVAHKDLRIQASKQGEVVVFTIADGRGRHRVVQSESPRRFDPTSAVQVRNGGSFRQDADSGPDLVFYRID